MPILGSLLGNWKLLLGVGLAAIVGTFALHYAGVIRENSRLEGRIGKLEMALETQGATVRAQEDVIREWQASQERIQRDLQTLKERSRDARLDRQRLQELFAESNLSERLAANPEAVARAVNDGTDRAFRLLECASGSGDTDCPDGIAPPDAGDDTEAGPDLPTGG